MKDRSDKHSVRRGEREEVEVDEEGTIDVIASTQVRRTRHGATHNPISPILSVGKYNPE